MITKSKFVSFCTCPRYYYLDINNPEDKKEMSEFQMMLTLDGNKVGALARSYFGPSTLIEKDSNINMALKTKEELSKGPGVICEASFIYKDLFCAVDVLKVDSDGVEIYEVKSTTHVKESYIYDSSFQNYVLTKAGLNVKGVHLLIINNEYIFNNTLDLKEYFKCVDVETLPFDFIEPIINNIRLTTIEPDFVVNPNCKKDCPFFDYCFKNLPEHNIYNLAGLTNKYKLYNEGIITYDDYVNKVNSKGKVATKCLEQISFDTLNLPIKIDKKKVSEFINKFTYPLYYLDFETIRDVVPFINGTSPEFTRVVQYSLHIENDKNSNLIHKEYLQEREYDNLEEVADRLILDLGETGSILTYNQSFEKGRIQALGKLLPHKKEALEKIADRIVDLEVPFKNRWIYSKEMKGRSSIKYVLPAICPDSENAYKSLPLVHNGTEAMSAYNTLINCEGVEHEKIKEGLLLYCGLDTMAMVDILKKIHELLDQE